MCCDNCETELQAHTLNSIDRAESCLVTRTHWSYYVVNLHDTGLCEWTHKWFPILFNRFAQFLDNKCEYLYKTKQRRAKKQATQTHTQILSPLMLKMMSFNVKWQEAVNFRETHNKPPNTWIEALETMHVHDYVCANIQKIQDFFSHVAGYRIGVLHTLCVMWDILFFIVFLFIQLKTT